MIDRLPNSARERVLEAVGFQHVTFVRLVCRRWRDAVKDVVWQRLDVVTTSRTHADRLASLVVRAAGSADGADAAAPGDRRWIRVAPGASLRLRIEESPYAFAHVRDGAGRIRFPNPTERWAHARTRGPAVLAGAASLVAACAESSAAAAAGGGGGGLAELEVELGAPSGACVLDLLRSPALAAAAGPSLRGLQLRSGADGHGPCGGFPGDFKKLLLSFPRLESLALPRCCSAEGYAVDQIAAALPNLKQLTICLAGFEEGGGGLAALGRLEILELCRGVHADEDDADAEDRDARYLIESLADGPAARSLKELRLRCPASISGGALLALPRLAALERLDVTRGIVQLGADVGEEALAALGACPALRTLPALLPSPDVEHEGDRDIDDDGDGEGEGEEAPGGYGDRVAEQLAGLAAALERSSTLETLDLLFNHVPRGALAGLGPLARASRGRLSLKMEVDLEEAEDVARAAAALAPAAAPAPPPLRRLALTALVGEKALRGRWLGRLAAFARCSAEPPEVSLNVSDSLSGEEEEVRSAIRDAVKGALPSARVNVRMPSDQMDFGL
eukprot:tig00000411_g524.t1